MYQQYLKVRDNLEVFGLHNMIILKYILREEFRLVKFEKRELSIIVSFKTRTPRQI
jgi:hypothetical protein